MKRLNFLKSAIIIASTVFVLSSCGDKEPKDIMVENETALTQTSFADETSGKSGVTFITTGAWTSTITEGTTKSTKSGTTSWVSISPDHGDAAGTYTIIISLEPNATGKDRAATITISCNGMDITVTVTQKGVPEYDGDDEPGQASGITYPATGKGGTNILADGVVMVKPTLGGVLAEYSVRAVLPEGSSLKIVISGKTGDFGFYSGTNENWSVVNSAGGQFTLTAIESGRSADAAFSSYSDVCIEYYENGATTPTKVKNVYVGGDTEDDEANEREMLIAFYKSTNGDNWVRKDNWCSDKPVSLWYGIKTFYHAASAKSHVRSIELPGNNLTGEAYVADFKFLEGLNILNGNKIETLTVDNCGNEISNPYFDYNIGFYHDHNYSHVHLKTLKISRTNGYIYANGNFSADNVIISDCKLSAQEYMYFNLPSTTAGTLTVSDCTMGYFYADNSVIGNIIIDNCTFLEDKHGSRASIYVGNRTEINNCKGLQSIYSSRKCSDLIVTNTICNDIQCKQ